MATNDPDRQPESKKRRGLPITWLLIGLAVVVMACGVGWDAIADKAPAIQAPDLSKLDLPEGMNPSSSVKLPEGATEEALKGLGFDQRNTPDPMKGINDMIEGVQGAINPPPGSPSPIEAAEKEGSEPEAVFRLGFGFTAGFAAAFAMRKLFKVTMFAAGLVFMLLLGLEYAQLIDIRWGAMADRYDSFEAWAGGQFASFRAFITGAVPMTATALAGIAAGWKAG